MRFPYSCWINATADTRLLSEAKKTLADNEKDSIFSAREDTWDNIFKDIKSMPPLVPNAERRSAAQGGRRRQAMTAREISAFDDMFNMIFSAVSNQSQEKGDGEVAGRRNSASMSDLFGRLRKHGKRNQWNSDADAALDRMREEMELCDTDQQLLDWAMRVVFSASKTAAEAAQAVLEAEKDMLSARLENFPPLQPLWYPHIVAQLIRTFRDKYHDPHLALAVFDHASKLSVPSYVFGCTTAAYNELLETKWRAFQDIRGVLASLEEMRINAVEPDNRTRTLVEAMRRDLVASSAVEGDEAAEVMDMLQKAERLSMGSSGWKRQRSERAAKADSVGIQKTPSRRWTSEKEWKRSNARSGDHADAEYEFNKWSTA